MFYHSTLGSRVIKKKKKKKEKKKKKKKKKEGDIVFELLFERLWRLSPIADVERKGNSVMAFI